MKISILSSSSKGNLPVDDSRVQKTENYKFFMAGCLPTDPAAKHEPKISIASKYQQLAHEDPSICPTYLSSPLETILESLDDHDMEYISIHDIIEAYSILSSRLRSRGLILKLGIPPPLALAPLKEHAQSLAGALKRDMRRALAYDSRNLRRAPSFYEMYSTDVSMTEHDLQHTRDISTICQYSLRVLSDVFALQPLYQLFSVRDLEELLNELLKIASATTLPTPNANKIWSLVFWTLQAQDLPSVILLPKKDQIVATLRRALNGEKGYQSKLDGLQAIHSFMKRHPSNFVQPLTNFLPVILTNLVSEDAGYRLQAANALCGFSLAKLQMLTSEDFPHESISLSIHTFLKEQISPAMPSQVELYLPNLISQAFISSNTKDPIWALLVLCCLITLSDHSLFLRSTLRFCVDCLRPAIIHKCKDIRLLTTPVWGSLVWALSRFPVDRRWNRLAAPDTPVDQLSQREKAFRIVKQQVDRGKGVVLVEALLRTSLSSDPTADSVGSVARALIILQDVLDAAGSDAHQGIAVLHRLLSGIGNSGEAEVSPNSGVSKLMRLFDGTLLHAGPSRTKDIVHSLTDMDVNCVRLLDEKEVVRHWDTLVTIWITAAKYSLQTPSHNVSSEILSSWQALLLARADFTQEHGHLTPSSSLVSKIASTVNRFLVQSAAIDDQVRCITMVKKLWGVMKNVFPASRLPAESILAATLKANFSLDDESVRSVWSQFCADLISVGVPSLLHVLFTRSERQEGQVVTRELWIVLARTWQVQDEKSCWEDLVSFLVIPFKAWSMSDGELKLWEGTLRSAVIMASTVHIEPIAVLERIVQRMGEKELNVLVSFPKGVATLLKHVDSFKPSSLPSRLFGVVDWALTSNYPPRPELLAACLGILHLIAEIFRALSTENLFQAICTVGKGLCCWIGDEKEVMLSAEHDLVVKRLYCSSLDSLRHLPPSREILLAISPFLSSAFGRVSPSAIGPLAFQDFWRVTYHGCEEYRSSYPDCLKACLLGFSDAYGGSIAEGLSMSQGTGMSSVPDSQPSYRNRYESLLRGLELHGYTSSSIAHRLLPRQISPEPLTKRMKIDTFTLQGNRNGCVAEASRQCPSSSSSRPCTPLLGVGPSKHRESYNSLFGSDMPQADLKVVGVSKERSLSGSPKRRSSSISGGSSKKRRKTEPDLHAAPSMQRLTSTTAALPTQIPLATSDILFSPPTESFTQNTETRKRKRVTDWISDSMNSGTSMRSGARDASRPGPQFQTSKLDQHQGKSRASTPSPDEYDSWEAGVSLEEVQELRRELVGSDHEVPVTDVEDVEDDDVEETNNLNSNNFFPGLPAHFPQHRSQTVPCAAPPRLPGRAQPLRRSQTSSARLEALENAYAAVANGASQIPVEDLVHAAGVVTRIQTKLNEQLTRKLAADRSGNRKL